MSYLRAEERQRQILACAKRVFAERGFHAANISHICAEAGIGRGTLYQYFANKLAVLTAILDDCLERVKELMRSFQEDRAFPPPESLDRAEVVRFSAGRLRRVLEAVFQDEPTLRILLREAVGLDAAVEKLLGEIDESIVGIVEADLRATREAGLARPDLNPRLTATLIVGGVEKLAIAALRGDEPIALRELALEASRLHLVGILSSRVPSETEEPCKT